MGESLAVVTPWYPAPCSPFGGAFVEAVVESVHENFSAIDVWHGDEWAVSLPWIARRLVPRMYGALIARRSILPLSEHEAKVHRFPVLLLPGGSYAGFARSHERFLRRTLRGGRLPASVVHAHVGLAGGWPALQLAEAGARVFVTEHATFLNRVLSQSESRIMYDEVIERCTKFFCVSSILRQQLLGVFPHHEGKIHVIPNAIPFERIPIRVEPVTDLRRWLYVGNFIERKGVMWVLEAFALCRMERPDLELTMVGGGRQRGHLAKRIAQLGLEDSVHLVNAVSPERIFDFFFDHDLLVHASRYETFGMTMVEAIATGMPVLVTRCGGPEETLAGIEADSGELVSVSDSAVELVEGYRRLAARLPSMDVSRARGELDRRYSYTAVANLLSTYYFGNGPSGTEIR